MRARLLYMTKELRRTLGVSLWQIFDVDRIEVRTIGWKYPRETKHIYCKDKKRPKGTIMFYWYEVELMPK